jgi:hypothetical protein
MADGFVVEYRHLAGQPLTGDVIEARLEPFEATRAGDDDWHLVEPIEQGWRVVDRGSVRRDRGLFLPISSTVPIEPQPVGRAERSLDQALYAVLG